MAAVEFELSDRLGATHGIVSMTGVHALIRVTADQHRADRARGLRTAGGVGAGEDRTTCWSRWLCGDVRYRYQ